MALLDEEDVDIAQGYSWYAHKGNGDYHYAATLESSGARNRIWMHNLVMERILGRKLKKGELVDHKNRDKLDNRRENVRVANRTQNEANKAKGRRGVSKYKGIYPERGKWRAVITVNRKRYSLGSYFTERDAARAYDKAAVEHFGEFAYLNFPEEHGRKE